MKAIKWFLGFFQDQDNSASSKRATLYIALFFLWMIIKGNLEGKTVDSDVLYCITGLIFWCVGAVTTEYFKKKDKPEKHEEHTT